MSLRKRDLLLGVVFVALLGSNFMLVKLNTRLRSELNVANLSIAKLRKNAFHDGVLSDGSAAPELVLYNYPQPGQASSGSQSQASRESSPGLSLIELKTKYLGTAAQSKFTLFVFFSPTDCNYCLQESTTWQRLHADGQRLSLYVVGVMDHPDKTEAEQFLKQLAVTFPVFSDNTSSLKAKYRIGVTPEKVLVNSQGEILLISPRSETDDEKRAFEQSVKDICSREGF